MSVPPYDDNSPQFGGEPAPPPFGMPGPAYGPPLYGPPLSGPPLSGPPQSGPVYPPPGYGGAMMPAYAMAIDPATGQPLSDKSKITAGLLQLVLGAIFVLGGVGRLYAGNTTIGVVQILATALAWVSFFCGFLFLLPFILTVGCWMWFIVDGIMMLVGRPVDGQGRLLRG